ncbi:MAG: hypothetical protein ACRDHF_12715 [Tepidiformaceae bacterium]
MSERPWWFPTAVFVAPVGGALFAFGTVADLPGLIDGLLVVVGIFAPIVDLARREDRWRDRIRPPAIGRWGPRSEWPPRRVLWRWPVTLGTMAVASAVGCATGTLIYRGLDGWGQLIICFAALVFGWDALASRYQWRDTELDD